MGFPVLHWSSSCTHAVATTPADSLGVSFSHFPSDNRRPRFSRGSTAAFHFSRIAQRSLTLRPAYSPSPLRGPLHRRLQPFRHLHSCSDCYRLERQLPGGIRTHWKTVPLHGAPRTAWQTKRNRQAPLAFRCRRLPQSVTFGYHANLEQDALGNWLGDTDGRPRRVRRLYKLVLDLDERL